MPGISQCAERNANHAHILGLDSDKERFVAKNGVTRRSHRFSVVVGCFVVTISEKKGHFLIMVIQRLLIFQSFAANRNSIIPT